MGSAWVLSTAVGLFATASVAPPAPAPPPAPLTTVAVDLSGLAEQDWKQLDGLALERRVVLRLVQDGFAVVASSANPDVRLTVTRTGAGLHLVAHSRARDAEGEVPIGADALSELHLEIAQKSAELARSSAPPPPEVAPPPPPAPPPKERTLNVGGALGFVVRQGGTDVAVRLVARYGRLLGGELSIGLVPSAASAVTVLELPVTLGFGVRLELGLGFALEAALAGGVRLHTFFLADPAAPERVGVRADAIASVPVTLTFLPLPWGGIGLRVAPGVASGVRDYPGWSRGQWWFEANGMAFLRF